MQSDTPLIDLHRHLDGSVRVSTILDLAKQYNIALPASSLSELERCVYVQDRSADLLDFLKKLDYGVSVLASLDACERIAYESVEDAYQEGLSYVELRFSPYYMAQSHALDMSELVAAVISGVSNACVDFDIQSSLIGILSRTFGEACCDAELEALMAHHSHIEALDLAGDELNFPAARFTDHFAKARAKTNWRYTIHAGEADGASSVWDAIKLLHASRIGHGVRAIEDPKLMDYLAQHNIGIESCLSSNYQTGTWVDTPSHPLKRFLEHGIQACLNTDDPGVSNITLKDEFDLAQNVLGLTQSQCEQLKLNAKKQAFKVL
ncbi:adenosine deaminase [Ningiella sp. W23]|uniref:adenosine deaminase n=1 Tax=Ningiella sp. W23 TaxID=3023715 RepID=UPI0037568316